MSKYRLYRAMYDWEGKHCGNEYIGEVITCKECEYGQYDCTHMYCDYFGHKVYKDDYCSNAVRRSNAVKRREP